MGDWTRTLILALAMASAPVSAAPQVPAPQPVDQTLHPYASMRDSVRLSDGRMLHLVCSGHGAPTVILTAGAGDWSLTWNKVQPAIAARTRVCAWDRAGFGLSTPGAKPQTVDQTTSDLEAALRRGGIVGPYIAVGHSLGGYESLLFKDRQPGNVVGMVLVDPSVPDQSARFARVAPAVDDYVRGLDDSLSRLFAKCATALRSGVVRRGGPDPDGCLRGPRWPATFPPELRVALDRMQARASARTIAAAMDGIAFYRSPPLLERNSRIVINPRRNFADMPLIVLTSGKSDDALPTDFPAAARAQWPLRDAEWRRAHDELAALSTRGVNRIVPGATHYIQADAPEAVIAAIDEVIDAARAPQRLR